MALDQPGARVVAEDKILFIKKIFEDNHPQLSLRIELSTKERDCFPVRRMRPLRFFRSLNWSGVV